MPHRFGTLCAVRNLRFAITLLLLGILHPAGGHAQEGDAASAPEDVGSVRRAAANFREGISFFQNHNFREAIRAFTLAVEEVPSADLWFNIARSHEQLAEYDEAIEFYQRYLRDRVDPPDRADVLAHIENLRARSVAESTVQGQEGPSTGTLRLSSNLPGSEVLLDSARQTEAHWSSPQEVAVGAHQLSVLGEGYIPFRAEVDVSPGQLTAAYADLVPETRYRSVQGDSIFSWISWGLSLVAVGASVGFGIDAASRIDNDLEGARTNAAFSDGAIGVAVGFGVLGTVLYFLERRSVATLTLTPPDAQSTGQGDHADR